MILRRLMPRHRWWALVIPLGAATATCIIMLLAAGVPLNPVELWAKASPPNPPLEAFVPLVGFGAWNLAPHVALAVALVVFGRSRRSAWVVLVAGTAVIGAGALLTIGYAFGPGGSSTSPLVFLSLPVVLWAAIIVLLIVVGAMVVSRGAASSAAQSRNPG